MFLVYCRSLFIALLAVLLGDAAAGDLDRNRAALHYPRSHMRGADPGAIRTKLNQQLMSSSAVRMTSYAMCDDFKMADLNTLLLELQGHRHPDLLQAFGRQPRHLRVESLLAEIQREASDIVSHPELEEPIRHGKCHEIAMQWVHHMDQEARAKLSHLRLPLLPEKGTQEHAPELLRDGHHTVLQVLKNQTTCQTGHAATAETRGNWTPTNFPVWPFEVTYEAAGYGPYPFWAANTPGSGSLTGSGKLLSNTYSAVLNAEKFDHKGGCGLGDMQLGWNKDAPCTLLMLGNKYNYLYDNEEKSCCVASTPGGDCPLQPMKRDFYDLFKLQGTVDSFTTESRSYSGSVKKYTMQIDLTGPGPTGAFYFWYVTDANDVPVEQGEAGCDSCIAPEYGKHYKDTNCDKTATVDQKRVCSKGPKFLFHQYNRSSFKEVTLDPSVFKVPDVCKNTKYSCAVTPADQLCSRSKVKHVDFSSDVVV